MFVTPDKLPAGPYRQVSSSDGTEAPLYLMPFDEHGRSQAPLTRDHLIGAVRDKDFTDIFLFCHGWNNDFETADRRYGDFLKNYLELGVKRNLNYKRPIRPLLVGMIWPSTELVAPWEEAPELAGGAPGDDLGQEQLEVEEIASRLPPKEAERFRILAQNEELTEEETLELATILLPIYQPEDNSELPPTGEALDSNGLVEIWRELQGDDSDDTTGEFGFDDDEPVVGEDEPAAAFDVLSPIAKVRDLLRATTVLMMKDRAGVVGAHGVGDLLRDILSAKPEPASPKPRVHLIGHSYGCKVMLSALCYQKPPRKVDSVLLLQPAIGRYCFAVDATGNKEPGGYRSALERSTQPIMTTFSKNDKPLTRYFHFVAHRQDDEGEVRIAAWLPSGRFKALGGYGPAGSDDDTHVIDMLKAPELYEIADERKRILALRADKTISGHSDISNEATWWALYNQVNQP